MGVVIASIIAFFVGIIGSSHGFANHHPAFESSVHVRETDLKGASAAFPRRLFTVLAATRSLAAIEFSMVNRDIVPETIQLDPSGEECTILAKAPLTYSEVALQFPGGAIPVVVKASHKDQPDTFTVYTVRVKIEDVNDHAPSFYENSLQSFIFPSQNLEDVNPIFRLRAHDDDAVETGCGKVTYRLTSLIFVRSDGSTSSGELSKWFRIDSETGNVDLLQLPNDDRAMKLTVFASDSPLGREAPLTATANALLLRENVEKAIKFETAVSVKEGQGTSPFEITSIDLPAALGIDEKAQLRFTILNKGDIPQEVSVEGNAELSLVSSGPLDYEKHGASFSVDVLVEYRHFASTLAPGSPPLRAVVRMVVKLENVEDEKPVFHRETLDGVVARNADLSDVNPVLRVRARKKEASEKKLRYSIRSVVTKKRHRDMLDYFNTDSAIEIDGESGNVKLMRATNDLVTPEVEELILEVVAEDGSLTTVERATIKLVT